MWYCSILLQSRDVIKEKHDIDSDEYNDLLIVEKEIERFKQNNLFSSVELELLDMMFSAKIVDRKRYYKLVKDELDHICIKLALSLGGIFTNEGYIEYMREKHNLTDEQVFTLEKYMLSHLRNRILYIPFIYYSRE